MGMSFRDWLIILGVLAVVLIIADGLRRVWMHRRRANELNFGLEEIKWQGEEYSSELPNGGARSFDRDSDSDIDNVVTEDSLQDKRLEPFISDLPEFTHPEADDGSFEHGVVSAHREEGITSATKVSLVEQPVTDENKPATAIDEVPEEKGQQSLDLGQPVPVLMEVDDRQPGKTGSGSSAAVHEKPATKPVPEVISAIEPEQDEPVFTDSHHGTLKKADEVLIINLMARKGAAFAGRDLYELFMSEGLRFGDMNIFHRHVRPDGRGDILYSVANGVEPGTFNLKTMEQDSIPALSFFMGLPGPEGSESMQTFRIMVESVFHLVEELDGVVKDERHSVLTQQTLEHYRQRISDFERRRMTGHRNDKARV